MSRCHMTRPHPQLDEQTEAADVHHFCEKSSEICLLFIFSSHPLRSSFCFLHLTNKPQTQNSPIILVLAEPRLDVGRCDWLRLCWVETFFQPWWFLFFQLLFSGSRVRNMNHDHIQSPGLFVNMVLFALHNVVRPASCDCGKSWCGVMWLSVWRPGDGGDGPSQSPAGRIFNALFFRLKLNWGHVSFWAASLSCYCVRMKSWTSSPWQQLVYWTSTETIE